MARRLSRCFATAAASLGLSFGGAATAAERIVIQFGEFSRDVAVPSLVTFTETGVVNRDLRSYLQMLRPPERKALRMVLNQRVPVDAVMAANFLSTPLGERSLQQLVKVIDQPPSIAGPALSSALILGSSRQGDLRLIDVLQAYPTQILPVNAAAVLSLTRSLSQQFNLQNRLFPQIASINGTPAPGPNLADLAMDGEISYSTNSFSFVGRDGTTITAVAYLPATAMALSPAPLGSLLLA